MGLKRFSPERVDHWKQQLVQSARRGQSLQSMAMLTDFDLPVANSRIVHDVEDALQFAHQIGYPLVAKIEAPTIAHKSDVGGVILNIQNDTALSQAFARLQTVAPGPGRWKSS